MNIRNTIIKVLDAFESLTDPVSIIQRYEFKKFDIDINFVSYEDEYASFTNDISSNSPQCNSIIVHVPSFSIREKYNVSFRIRDDNNNKTIWYPDVVDEELTIDSIEELIFNISLKFGDTINLNKLIFVYVLYMKYSHVNPNLTEMRFCILFKQHNTLHEFMESL